MVNLLPFRFFFTAPASAGRWFLPSRLAQASEHVSSAPTSRAANGPMLKVSRQTQMRSLPPCGGGLGRGVGADAQSLQRSHSLAANKNRDTESLARVTPLPVPPPQGGRERSISNRACIGWLARLIHRPARHLRCGGPTFPA